MFWSTLPSIEYKILTIHIVPYIAIYPISQYPNNFSICQDFVDVQDSLPMINKVIENLECSVAECDYLILPRVSAFMGPRVQ